MVKKSVMNLAVVLDNLLGKVNQLIESDGVLTEHDVYELYYIKNLNAYILSEITDSGLELSASTYEANAKVLEELCSVAVVGMRTGSVSKLQEATKSELYKNLHSFEGSTRGEDFTEEHTETMFSSKLVTYLKRNVGVLIIILILTILITANQLGNVSNAMIKAVYGVAAQSETVAEEALESESNSSDASDAVMGSSKFVGSVESLETASNVLAKVLLICFMILFIYAMFRFAIDVAAISIPFLSYLVEEKDWQNTRGEPHFSQLVSSDAVAAIKEPEIREITYTVAKPKATYINDLLDRLQDNGVLTETQVKGYKSKISEAEPNSPESLDLLSHIEVQADALQMQTLNEGK